mgnify:CR=1 FL=1
MLYRENGQFKTDYRADQQVFPIKQDRIAIGLLLAFAVIAWLAPDVLTAPWEPLPYSLSDLYGLAYVGVGLPLVWWFAVQPLRARFWVQPETGIVWWVGAAGLAFAALYWAQVLGLHWPTPRPDVAPGIMAILLVGVAASHILAARRRQAGGTVLRAAMPAPRQSRASSSGRIVNRSPTSP